MKCKYCKRDIPNGSIYCLYCGMKQIKERSEITVPVPRQLKSGKWHAQLMIGGVRYPITEDTEAKYYAKARAMKAELIETGKVCNKTVGECVKEYIDRQKNMISPATYKSYSDIKKNHFKELQELKVSQLTLDILDRHVNAEAARYKPKTVVNAFGLIAPAIEPYTDIDLSKVRRPEIGESTVPVYSDKELQALFKAVKGDPIELAVYLAGALGLRRSEILALTPEDFDREKKTVRIGKARVPDEHNNLVEKNTKTKTSNRVVSCPDFILDLVPEEGTGYLYGQYKQNYILARLKRICQREGLPDITLHGLRHSNASQMLLVMPDLYAMKRGGWSTDRAMKKIYQHTFSKEQAEYNKIIDEHFKKLHEESEKT